MGDAAVDHSKSFVTVSENGAKADLHLFFRAMTFSNLTGHLLEISNLTDPVIVEGILDDYTLVPASVVSWLTETDAYLPAGRQYPGEVVLPVTPGVEYTPVFVNVPVMAGFENQPARVRIDWSEFGVAPPADTTPPISKTPEASVSIAVAAPTVTGSVTTGKKVENAVADNVVTTSLVNGLATEAKAAANGKPAGETIVAEVKIAAAALPADTTQSEVKEIVTTIPKAAVEAIVEEAAKSADVEFVLTVESGLAAVTLDAVTLVQLANTAAESDNVSVAIKADATATLTSAQASNIPANKVPIAVTISAGDEQIIDLAHEIAITIPYTKIGGSDKKVVVWYVSADGNKIKCDAAYESGRVTFVTKKI
jgi:hypothetical protein